MPMDSLNDPLEIADNEIYNLIEKEKQRQYCGLELIASENFTSLAVMQANGSPLTNKYSEGLPGARYYGGNEYIDEIENICKKRALDAFKLDELIWGVNVQPYSGSTANFAALTGLLLPHERIMGLDLPSGGHLTHGYQTAKKKLSCSSIYFESFPYKVNPETGLVDYESLKRDALAFNPKLIICGGSAYPREWNYVKLREIADEAGAFLMADIAHISGLIIAEEAQSPFQYCDVVTTTTHKTLRGPRAGLIFYRKLNEKTSTCTDLELKINQAVFPICQGGPHNNTIAAIAVALKQASNGEFKNYAKQVRKNASSLCTVLINEYGYKICTNGTDNHLILWDLRPLKLTGSKFEKLCEMVSITLNKNSVPGDKSAMAPGGVRIGTPALTSRGFVEKDFAEVAKFLRDAVELALKLQKISSSTDGKCTLSDFAAAAKNSPEVLELKEKVEIFSRKFPMPGFTLK